MLLNYFLRNLHEGPVHSIIFSAISHLLALEDEFVPVFEGLYACAAYSEDAFANWKEAHVEYTECGHAVHIRFWMFLYCLRLDGDYMFSMSFSVQRLQVHFLNRECIS